MSPGELIDKVALSMYEPPLVNTSVGHRRLVSELGVLLLILDFDVEVQMSGVGGFLENSTGAFINETIAAFDLIGASATSLILKDISVLLERSGIPTEALHAEHNEKAEFEYGPLASEVMRAIDSIAKRLYLYSSTDDAPYLLLHEFVSAHEIAIKSQMMQALGLATTQDS